VLAVAPWFCVLASPYATELPGYYRRMLVAPAFAGEVAEWQPPWSSPYGVPLLVGAVATLVAVVLRWRRLTAWERTALVVVALGGVSALRGAVWLALAALVLLPGALSTGSTAALPRAARRARLGLAITSIAIALVALAATLAAPRSRYAGDSPSLDAVVAREAAANPRARVLATDGFADRLLWRRPELRGRLAFDARFELLTGAELNGLSDFLHRRGADWRAVARPYGLLVLDRRYPVADALAREAGVGVLFRDANVVVLEPARSS
jgi:hypothetical protein